MARYVISSRRAGKFTQPEKALALANVARVLKQIPKDSVVKDYASANSLGRRSIIIEMDHTEAEIYINKSYKSIIFEPLIKYWNEIIPPYDISNIESFDKLTNDFSRNGQHIKIGVTANHIPLFNAEVILYSCSDSSCGVRMIGCSDVYGQCHFILPDGHSPSVAVINPRSQHWPMIARGAQVLMPIECPELPMTGPTSWWHDILKPNGTLFSDGAGIRIGVADTGVGHHPALAHATPISAFIDGNELSPNESFDVAGHGTHVCGTIGARPTGVGDYIGLAPGSELYYSRIFRDASSGANNADIAAAIEALSRDHKVDLINLSLGGGYRSEVVVDAVTDAFERGTLCIAAAGNSNGPVEFPANLDNVVAISALGLEGAYPASSLSADRVPTDPNRFGNDGLFAADFSCFGYEVGSTAPGVGIIAPVPDELNLASRYGVMDGTSMAAPAACGVLASLLSRNQSYLAMPRNSDRSIAAKRIMAEHARTVGLKVDFEGGGMLQF